MTRAEAREKVREAWDRIEREWGGSAKGAEESAREAEEVLAALENRDVVEPLEGREPRRLRLHGITHSLTMTELRDAAVLLAIQPFGDAVLYPRDVEQIVAFAAGEHGVVLVPGTDEARRAAYAIEDGSAQPWAHPWKDELAALARRLRGEQ